MFAFRLCISPTTLAIESNAILQCKTLLLRWKEALSVEGEMPQISPDDLAGILGWWAMAVGHTAIGL